MKPSLAIFLVALPMAASAHAAKLIVVEPYTSCQSATLRHRNTLCGISSALKRLEPGDTLELKAGVYHQPLDLRESAGYAKANRLGPAVASTTIKGPRHGTAIIDGSTVVKDWHYVSNGVWIRTHWDVNSEQGFINGEELKQIGGTIWSGYPENPASPLRHIYVPHGIWPGRVAGNERSLKRGQYYYNQRGKQLYVRLQKGVDPNQQRVSFSVAPYLLFSQGWDRLSIENLSFRHSNTSAVSQAGAITLSGNDLVLKNVSVKDVDSTGIAVAGNHNRIEGSSVIGAGRLGFNVRGKHVLLVGDVANRNNTRGFNKYWEAGGFKFVGAGGLRFSTLKRLVALRNKGDGIWFDWKNHNVHLYDSVSAYNSGFGIHVEVSHDFLISGNEVYGNGQRGISLASSQNVLVTGNVVADNGLGGIISLNENRGPGTQPAGIRVCGNWLLWNHGVSVGLPDPLDRSHSFKNTFILEMARPEFSLGDHVGLSGLRPWRVRYGQGQGSKKISAKVPPSVKDELKGRRLINWKALLANLGASRTAGSQKCRT